MCTKAEDCTLIYKDLLRIKYPYNCFAVTTCISQIFPKSTSVSTLLCILNKCSLSTHIFDEIEVLLQFHQRCAYLDWAMKSLTAGLHPLADDLAGASKTIITRYDQFHSTLHAALEKLRCQSYSEVIDHFVDFPYLQMFDSLRV